jgi:hypothetical protein
VNSPFLRLKRRPPLPRTCQALLPLEALQFGHFETGTPGEI